MKPRVIAPYKILVVALATSSCGKATSEERPTPPVPVGSVEAPPRGTPSAVTTVPVVTTLSDDKVDPKLLLLRAELDNETRETAFAKQPHYRPLCDKDGYPIVGNLNRKSPSGPQPSELCAEVRKKAKPS